MQDQSLKPAIISSEKGDFQVDEIIDKFQASAINELVVSEEAESCKIEQNAQASPRTPLRTVGAKAKSSSPLPETNNNKQPKLTPAPNKVESNGNENESETKWKEDVSENDALDNNSLEEMKTKQTAVNIKMAGVTTGTPGFPTTTLSCFSSFQELAANDAVTEGNSQKIDADSKEGT